MDGISGLSAIFPRLTSIDRIAAATETWDALAGESIILAGTDVDAVFFIIDGELEVTIDTADGSRTVGRVPTGGMVGEASLLAPGPATATVSAVTDATLIRLSRDAFAHLCASDPAAASALLGEIVSTLGARLDAANTQLEELVGPDGLRPIPGADDRLVGIHATLQGGAS